ncbi:MAG TPA: SRPBCC domain-containing protein [Actinomycetota bacterium]|jgi:carbon monoxide dehydrogenase subunit G
MQFKKTIRIDAPISRVWALNDEIEAVAKSIPGVSEVNMISPDEFECRLKQDVGPVSTSFRLRTTIQDRETERRVTALTEGRDQRLGSTVKAKQIFELRPDGDATEVDISADVQITGRIATFGQRIVSAKAEQVILEAMESITKLLETKGAGVGGS